MSSLLSIESFDVLPISQLIRCIVRFACLRFLTMCSFHVSLVSRVIPRYLVSTFRGIGILFRYMSGDWRCCKVNVMWLDLVSLIFMRHLAIQVWIEWRCDCRSVEATVGSSWEERIVMSSAKEPIVVCVETGRSFTKTSVYHTSMTSSDSGVYVTTTNSNATPTHSWSHCWFLKADDD
jgi:hypothetical protein